MTTQLNRNVTMDGLRGIAALIVMFYHLSLHTYHPLFRNAGVMVDLFFCLSGFVIAHSYYDKLRTSLSVTDFMKKRLVRLYPMFLMGLGIGAIALLCKVGLAQTSLSWTQAISAIGLNLVYLPYLGDFTVQIGRHAMHAPIFPNNDPGWSLFFELLVNVAFAYWAVNSTKIKPLFLALIGAILLFEYCISTGLGEPGWGSINFVGGFPRVTFGFFAGVSIQKFLQERKQPMPRIPPVVSFALLGLIILLSNIQAFSQLIWLLSDLILVPILVLAAACTTLQSNPFARGMDYIGWLSYPVYCLHYPIYALYTVITHNQDYGLTGIIMCATLSLAAAHFTAAKMEPIIRKRLFNIPQKS